MQGQSQNQLAVVIMSQSVFTEWILLTEAENLEDVSVLTLLQINESWVCEHLDCLCTNNTTVRWLFILSEVLLYWAAGASTGCGMTNWNQLESVSRAFVKPLLVET